MLTRSLVLLLVAVNLAGANAAPQAVTRSIYLPSVYTKQPPVEVVVTETGVDCLFCYPAYPYVKGYLRAVPGEPSVSVELEAEVRTTSYIPPAGREIASYESSVRFTPALSVTLQGQNNPFRYEGIIAKGSIEPTGLVRVARVTPPQGGGRPYPLTIVSSTHLGYDMSGEVRNDSGELLQRLRVVVVGPGSCSWREAALSLSTLAPGATAAFHLSYYCSKGPGEVLGQGFAQ